MLSDPGDRRPLKLGHVADPAYDVLWVWTSHLFLKISFKDRECKNDLALPAYITCWHSIFHLLGQTWHTAQFNLFPFPFVVRLLTRSSCARGLVGCVGSSHPTSGARSWGGDHWAGPHCRPGRLRARPEAPRPWEQGHSGSGQGHKPAPGDSLIFYLVGQPPS